MVGDGQAGAGPGGVVAAHTGGSELVPAATQVRHGIVDGEQSAGGDRAQRHDDSGADGGDLPHEEGRAGFALVALGCAVIGGAAFDDVGDVNLFALQSHGRDHVGEQLPGAADEGLALQVFV